MWIKEIHKKMKRVNQKDAGSRNKYAEIRIMVKYYKGCAASKISYINVSYCKRIGGEYLFI